MVPSPPSGTVVSLTSPVIVLVTVRVPDEMKLLALALSKISILMLLLSEVNWSDLL